MSFIWRLFRSKPAADDYESILASLSSRIQTRRTQLTAIRARERNASALVTLYTLAAWSAYVAVWYYGLVDGRRNSHGVERAVRAAPVVVGPIFILFVRRIVQVWYASKGNAEENTLQDLLKEQRTTVEALKKKTQFYETRELLAKYDSSSPSSPSPSAAQAPKTPARSAPPQTPANPRMQQSQSAPLPAPSPSQQQQEPRRWFDSVADVLLGPETERDDAKQKYALICEKCFTHNGLVPEAMWPDAQYKCPQCGHFNPSARSRRVLERAAGAQIVPPAGHTNAVDLSVSQNKRDRTPESRVGESHLRQRENRAGKEEKEEDPDRMQIDS
ncbi:unnamed protein product [Mycena citricolor]|uniref:Endoplasmic reticulum junction formation protein lunapark n=1 Tax=Mycena citricolor TaxID=2018698 RepID=A0AAD2K3P7_9AGAR|nr:unnamed protein product [Mycena citricolor]